MGESRYYFDDRWRGGHGIGRYAREVRSRSLLAYVDLGSPGSPSSPRDAVDWNRLKVDRRSLIYSPGYNAGVARAVQLVTIHDLIHLESVSDRARLNRIYYQQILRRAVLRTGFVVTVSKTSADAIATWVDDDRVEVLISGNGCSDVLQARERSDAGGSAHPYFLFVGNLRAHKNAALAMKTVAGVAGASLVVVNGDVSGFRQLAAAHGVADRVTVRPGIGDEELAELYRGAAALLFPSVIEGFGLPVLEALSSGCPVLYLESCRSAAEIAGDFGTGGVELPPDVDAWIDTARAALRDRPEIPPIPDRYDWDVVARALDGHVQRVAQAYGLDL